MLTNGNGNFCAGRVGASLSHCLLAKHNLHQMKKQVVWLAQSVPTEGITAGVSNDLQCPVVERAWQDGPTGIWDMLVPCKLASRGQICPPQLSPTEFAYQVCTALKHVPALFWSLTEFPGVDA